MTTEQIYQVFLKHPEIVTDSRKVIQNSLFFALRGDNFNGNEYAEEALKKGASYAVIDQKEFQVSEKTILVDDVLQELQKLANIHRKNSGIPILGITGTNGKTTTKELVAAVLSRKFNLIYTQGNLNNHIGVPLTLLRLDNQTEFAIIEMGANHEGEIAALCNITEPDFGLITNIGVAHLEGFGSTDTIKRTKAELYRSVNEKDGVIFYNIDNPILVELTNNINRKVNYGTANARLTGFIRSSNPFLEVEMNFPDQTTIINTNLIGSYNFENLMAAACIGDYFGVKPYEIEQALSGYIPKNNRSQLIEKGGMKIFMDAYNANPTSMKASINSFFSVFKNAGTVVLGDMLELGEKSREEHAEILKMIENFKFEKVFLVGSEFSSVNENNNFITFMNADALTRYLKHHPLNPGAVLIKGSRGIQLEKLINVF